MREVKAYHELEALLEDEKKEHQDSIRVKEQHHLQEVHRRKEAFSAQLGIEEEHCRQ